MLTIKSGGKSLKTPVKQICPPHRPSRHQNVENSAVDNILHLFKHVKLCIKVSGSGKESFIKRTLHREIQQLKLSAFDTDHCQGYQRTNVKLFDQVQIYLGCMSSSGTVLIFKLYGGFLRLSLGWLTDVNTSLPPHKST